MYKFTNKIFINRIFAHILNRIIIMIFAIFLAERMFYFYSLLTSEVKLNQYSYDSFFIILGYLPKVMFLPDIFIEGLNFYSKDQISLFIGTIEEGFFLLLSFAMIDTLFVYMTNGDVGKNCLDLKIQSTNSEKTKLYQLFFRYILKYLSLGFFPFFLLYPLIDKENSFLHDKLSKTRVINHENK